MPKNNGIFALSFLALGGAALYIYYRSNSANYGSFSDFLNDIFTKGSLDVNSIISGDIASKAASFIANEESFSATVYPDPPGQSEKFSIGYGHQLTGNDGFTVDSVIDQPTALQLLSSDIGNAIGCVDSYVTVPLTDNQKIALISFVYNVGCGAFRSSTMLKKINASDFVGAANEFGRWVYANGNVLSALVSRRSNEMEQFLA